VIDHLQARDPSPGEADRLRLFGQFVGTWDPGSRMSRAAPAGHQPRAAAHRRRDDLARPAAGGAPRCTSP
jgi:hypothetical protein